MSKIGQRKVMSSPKSSSSSLEQLQQLQIKETKLGSNVQLRHFVFEMIGTALLAFGIVCTKYLPPLNDKINNPFHNICISLSLYLAICLFSPFCPAHFNPSVSLGFCFKNIREIKQRLIIKKYQNLNQIQNLKPSSLFLKEQDKNYLSKNLKSFFLKAISQFLGAFVGVLLAYLIYDITVGPYDNVMPAVTELFTQIFGEVIGTFFFVFFILMVTSQMTTFITEDSWVHIFIPLSLYCGRTFSFHVCGLNPAIVMMAQVVKMMRTSDATLSGLLAVFLVSLGSLFGAYLASIFFASFYNSTIRNWREKSGQ